MRFSRIMGAVALTAAVFAGPAIGQDPGSTPLEVGDVAPDFVLPGATQYGVLQEPLRLSDFKGKTVVLAFFFRVRTRG